MLIENHTEHRPRGSIDVPVLPRTDSTSEFMPVDDKEVEYFFASDASAVIEHTNRVIYLEVSPFKNKRKFEAKFNLIFLCNFRMMM